MSAQRPPSRLPPGLVLGALLCASCDPPPVVPTADYNQNQNLSRIEGEVVVKGRVRGNALVFLYDTAHPPPPQGTGRPVSFTVIPQERLFGSADPASSGPFTAPYTFSLVAPGHYLVRGFIDANTCLPAPQPCHSADFIPWFGVTNEPNTGDMGGAAADPVTRALRVVDITANPDGALPAPTGVNVSFSDELTVPVDRPVFFVNGTSRFERTATTKTLDLNNLQVREGAVDQRPGALFVRIVDDDLDGKPDHFNSDGLPDVWPRVVVRKLAEGASLSDAQRLADENDLDRNGILDAQGAEYPRPDGSVDGLPDAVVLGAGLDSSMYDALRKPDGTWRTEAVPVPALRIIVQNKAYDARIPSQPQVLRTVPSGHYALTIIQFTGQTWRVPNELSAPVAAADGLPEVKGQAFFLEVP